MLIRTRAQGSLRELFGKVQWEGELLHRDQDYNAFEECLQLRVIYP